MTPNHHPPADVLISYAAGTLSSAESCVIACHLSMCGECAADARQLEMLGGLLLNDVAAPPAADGFAEQALARFPPQNSVPLRAVRPEDPLLPLPLARHLSMSGKDVAWEALADDLLHYPVPLPRGSGSASLLRVPPGKRMAVHELSQVPQLALVLQGALRSEAGLYGRGDVIELLEDGGASSLEAEGPQDCVCLVASEREPADLVVPFPKARVARPASELSAPRNGWRPAIAASVAVLAGLGLGWLLHGSLAGSTLTPRDLVRVEGNRLVAQGPLRTALEQMPSGQPAAALSGDYRLGIRMTFQNETADYCREYRIASPSAETYEGVACRAGGEWAIVIQALVPPAPSAIEQTVPAGSAAGSPMDVLVGALILGDPLVGNEEQSLLQGGWRK